mgnify:CR=1
MLIYIFYFATIIKKKPLKTELIEFLFYDIHFLNTKALKTPGFSCDGYINEEKL